MGDDENKGDPAIYLLNAGDISEIWKKIGINVQDILFYLLMGWIYIGIRDPISLGADQQGNPMWLYPSTSEAFIIESIVAAAIIFLGGMGFVLLYETTKNSFNYGYAIKLLLIWLTLAGLSFGLLQWMIQQKGG